jgi:hypothetical protein
MHPNFGQVRKTPVSVKVSARGKQLKAMGRVAVLLVLLLMSLLAQPLAAQTSRDYAVMARAVIPSFECATLASTMDNAKEQERLFNYGYKAGLAFLAALRAGKVNRTDLDNEVPFSILLLIGGPTPDFVLGRVYAAAEEEAWKALQKHRGYRDFDADLQKTVAQNEFSKRNCELLGSTSTK